MTTREEITQRMRENAAKMSAAMWERDYYSVVEQVGHLEAMEHAGNEGDRVWNQVLAIRQSAHERAE